MIDSFIHLNLCLNHFFNDRRPEVAGGGGVQEGRQHGGDGGRMLESPLLVASLPARISKVVRTFKSILYDA